ncbi:MAG: methyltransferase domain-containing protein [Candidatus Binatia bacterium]
MGLVHGSHALPGADSDLARMPGHWLLAQMGKRVLRPGGIELTRRMLGALAIAPHDHVVELAPGLGVTARLALARGPASYVAVERDAAAAAGMREILGGTGRRCIEGSASATGLEDGCASVVYGEAMLTMQTANQKSSIVREAFRMLKAGGRYGIHELALTPDDLAEERKEEVARDISKSIHVGARPLTVSEWRRILESSGFRVEAEFTAPMHLLEPRRLVQDEGALGALRVAATIAQTPAARRRVRDMRAVFRKHMGVLCAVALVAHKPSQADQEA